MADLISNPISSVLDLGGKILDKIFPDKEAAEAAKLNLIRMQQDGELKDLEIRLSTIITEAQSRDPWTSRARPSFLYVMYVLLLASIPFGALSVISPTSATSFATGFRAWFDALPADLYWLFGAGYLGYSGVRTFEKSRKNP